VGGFFVDEDESVDKLRVINSTANFLCNVDVVEVGIGSGFLVNDLEDGVDSDGGEEVRVVGDDL